MFAQLRGIDLRGIVTEADLRDFIEAGVDSVSHLLPVAIRVDVETRAPGIVRVLLREPRPRTWWRRALCAVADWLLKLAAHRRKELSCVE